MVEGINPSLSSSAVSNISKQRSSGSGDSARSADTSRRSSGASDVVEVSARGEDLNNIVETNRRAAGSEAPTTQDLMVAKNADKVAAALGNTVDISV